MPEQSRAGRLAPNMRFGRYVIVREIGSGGMGSVYEAIFSDLDKRVALKVLADELTKDEEHRRRFVREAQSAARIRHPNVVEVFDVGTHDGIPFLAMDFMRGEDLRTVFERGAMQARELVDIIMPVLSALVTAHEAGVIHRDLKPENIFLSNERNRSPRPMVLDFGISKVMDDPQSHRLTTGASMIGTPLYMSPEQARAALDIDERTDQYALSVVLYEGLAGKPPFQSDSIYGLLVCKMEGNAPMLKELRPDLPEDLCAAIERAMDPDRDARFSNIREFAQALVPFASKHSALSFALPSGLAAAASGSAPSLQPVAVEPQRNHSTLRNSAREVTVTPNPTAAQHGPKKRGLLYAGAALLLFVAGVFALQLPRPSAPSASLAQPSAAAHIVTPAALPPEPAPVQAFTLQVDPTPENASVTLDGETLGTGYLVRMLPRDGRSHTIVVSAEGYRSRELHFTDAAPIADVMLELIPAVTTPPPAPARLAWLAARRRARGADAAAKQGQEQAQPANEGAPSHRTTSNGAPIVY